MKVNLTRKQINSIATVTVRAPWEFGGVKQAQALRKALKVDRVRKLPELVREFCEANAIRYNAVWNDKRVDGRRIKISTGGKMFSFHEQSRFIHFMKKNGWQVIRSTTAKYSKHAPQYYNGPVFVVKEFE